MKLHLGIDNLIDQKFKQVRGAKVGLCTNISCCDSQLYPAFMRFLEKTNVHLRAIFVPEHGLFGALQDQIKAESFYDRRDKVVVYSVYNDRLIPDRQIQNTIDILVVDLQDIGTRYYTFVWSAILLMEQMARLGKKVVILDRPNPLNGSTVQGPVLEERFISFVGLYPIPIRHGMTIGELCALVCAEMKMNIDLEIIEMKGWRRVQYYDDTGVPWTAPSPNMPSLDTALVYPGMCLLEGTNVSEGRGTTRPFETFGAPWLNPRECARELMRKKMPGVMFRPTYFIPTFNKYCDRLCGGVQMYVTNRKTFNPITAGLEIVKLIKDRYPRAFKWRKPPYEFEKKRLPFDILIGNDWIRKSINARKRVSWMKTQWQRDVQFFKKRRKKYLLYT
jgi:uncharacterized protein YbbC (DUF1343 family)